MRGRPTRLWYVTGTYHGTHVFAVSEGEARRAFHNQYNGESILHVSVPHWPDPIPEWDGNFETY